MRTTVTIDDDLARQIVDAVHRERSSFKKVLNDALRRGLERGDAGDTGPFDYQPHSSTILPGWDVAGFNKLADEIEDTAILAAAQLRPGDAA